MENDSRLQVYKSIIQYMLESTHYTINNIADLTNSSIKTIREIYSGNEMPTNFVSEIPLIRLFQFLIEIELNASKKFRTLS